MRRRSDSSISRREWFGSLLRRKAPAASSAAHRPSLPKHLHPSTDNSERSSATPIPGIPSTDLPAQKAVIQGRFCLAYRHTMCTVCFERCPVPHAIQLTAGIPQIDPAICTGCGICHSVCPAPRNAILLLPAKPSMGSQPFQIPSA
jgi:Pyruvate/2-oxoacid:ferredoxin oxidoreductase delta subunit